MRRTPEQRGVALGHAGHARVNAPRTVNPLGDIRRSAAASVFGPGAIADFRTPSGAPVSGVICGLDEWIRKWPAWSERVNDPRLQKLLNVDHFKLPPVEDKDHKDRALPAVRLPGWLQCPKCDRIAHADDWSSDDGIADRWCHACTGQRSKRHRVMVVPVRFVVSCERGHLDDFPWAEWIQHAADCHTRKGPKWLTLVTAGAGLSGLLLKCTRCKATRSMEQAFDKKIMEKRARCTGRRPWLNEKREACTARPQTLQRGASNLYFPVVESSLLIPPWSDDLQERFQDFWVDVETVDAADRRALIASLLDRGKVEIPGDWDRGTFIETIAARAESLSTLSAGSIREEEWQRFVVPALPEDVSSDFEVRTERVPADIGTHVSAVVRAVRLRELRALRGFTRIKPPTDDGTGAVLCQLSVGPTRWLPAIEVRGEGIVVALDLQRVAEWERDGEVQRRVARANDAIAEEHYRRYGDDAGPPRLTTARHILTHTMAHATIRQLALECGYSTASLRERLYASPGSCGFLIYTATTDADGTLGGLQRQGEARRAGPLLMNAVQAQRWCSSDPLCITGAMSASNPTSGAACHACMLAPETSCEEYNRLLDRAFLVGLPDAPQVGYFQEWVGR